MVQSDFKDWIDKYFAGVVLEVVEKINGTEAAPSAYFHKRMLTPVFSTSGKWEAINADYGHVMADVVAMDSPLPLKKRDSQGGASGRIPKSGQKLWLNETQLTDLDTLIATGGTKGQIGEKIFEDTPRVIKAVPSRNEFVFLQGLSSGVSVVDDDTNVGTGIRVDYGYPTANKFGVSVLWSTPATSTVVDDVNRVLKAASDKGRKPSVVMMDKTALNNALQSAQIKSAYGWALGYAGDFSNIPNLTEDQLKSLFQTKFGLTIEVVDVTLRFQKDGQTSVVRPWADGAVVFLEDYKVGSLVYAKLAESNRPVPGVAYQTADRYILVSKYRVNDPIAEFTTSQARVLPVINGVNGIFVLDTKTVQA